MMGIFRTKQSTWSPYLHVDFQNASPTFPHAIVMLLYLFCSGINGEEGLEVGQRSVLAFSLAESLPSGVEARLPPPGPSAPLSCCPELGGLHSLLRLRGEQAPDHGNIPSSGHRPHVRDLGGDSQWHLLCSHHPSP